MKTIKIKEDREMEQKLIRSIQEKYSAEEIIGLAFDAHIPNFADGDIYVDDRDLSLHAHTIIGNSRPNFGEESEHFHFLYSYSSSAIANGSWEINDLLDHEEWETLEEKYGDDAYHEDDKQLDSIGIDLKERYREAACFYSDSFWDYIEN